MTDTRVFDAPGEVPKPVAAPEKYTVSVRTTRVLTDTDISGLLCCALEGGSNYWYTQLEPVLPEGLSIEEAKHKAYAASAEPQYWHWAEILPLVDGCAVTLVDTDEDTHTINKEKIEAGLQVMADKYPRHFADIGTSREDAATGDVFLQCVVFGDIVYG